MRWDAPLRELGSVVWIVVGAADVGGGGTTTEPGHRRGAAFVVVQMLAMVVLVTVVFSIKALLIPQVNPAYLVALGALLLSIPLALHWFAVPPRRGAGLAAGAAAGAVTGALAWFVLAPVVGAAWGAYLTPVLGFLVAAAVFGAVSATTLARTS